MRQKLITIAVVCVLAFFAMPLFAGISYAALGSSGAIVILGLLAAVQFPLLWYATKRSRLRIAKPDENQHAENSPGNR